MCPVCPWRSLEVIWLAEETPISALFFSSGVLAFWRFKLMVPKTQSAESKEETARSA
jgi:hypothetical protein